MASPAPLVLLCNMRQASCQAVHAAHAATSAGCMTSYTTRRAELLPREVLQPGQTRLCRVRIRLRREDRRCVTQQLAGQLQPIAGQGQHRRRDVSEAVKAQHRLP